MSVYECIRVAGNDQNSDRQFIAMDQYSIAKNKIFVDKRLGKIFNAPNTSN